MSDKERLPKKRVNFYDGQEITESDLDSEQIYNRTVTSEIVKDFEGSGVLKLDPFSSRILFDTRNPGLYSSSSGNPSKLTVEGGTYDGKGISLDLQPSDPQRGNRLVVSLHDVDISGRNRPKILIVGRTFDGLNSSGILNYEFIDFEDNTSRLTKFYYQKVIAVFFNNFSGGSGQSKRNADEGFPFDISLDLISSTNGYALFSEADPLSVFSKPVIQSQTASPSYDMINFVSSTPSNLIQDEIEIALDSVSNIEDIYFDDEAKEELFFPKDGSTTIAYGQKFLSRTNNLQRIDLLIAVERDDEQASGEEFDWSGDLVLGVHEISGSTKCATDAVPDDLIDFDPDLDPILEVSFSQEDLESMGFKLNQTSQIVSFNFSGTLIADPNIEPSIKEGKYYAFILSRRGDNRVGTLRLEKGYDNVQRKKDLSTSLSIVEQFKKQETRFLEFDPSRSRYIDDSKSSLWFKLYSDTIEVTSGTAYADSGKSVSIPKTRSFVGGNEISYFEDNIPLKSITSSQDNFVIFNQVDRFSNPTDHPISGNRVFSRIEDSASISVVNSDTLNELLKTSVPLILARVNDGNVRSAQSIVGELNKPGEILPHKVVIIEPSEALLSSNLVGRIFTPDTDCLCDSKYRISKVECTEVLAGDLDGDGKITYQDLDLLLNIVGNTINSSVTERAILSGDLDLIDFIKSDLNADDSVDGFDVDLLEDAIDGYSNFAVSEKIKVLELTLENVLEENDFPKIFEDALATGITSSGLNTINFDVVSYNQALAIRPGDIINIPSGVPDSGVYIVSSKVILSNQISVSLEVLDSNNDAPVFTGSSAFNIVIRSGTRVNMFANNLELLNLPYSPKSYSITFSDFPFTQRFIDICDLRRYVKTSFAEETLIEGCSCKDSKCYNGERCSPLYKNQTYIPGDLYVPNGQILTAPGLPHPGDYEYVNIVMPIPPGTISDCSVNIYDTFVKYNEDCNTAAGFPALKYSDGTFVGCNDSGANTDLSLGRVKFSHAIASLHVDALIDGHNEDDDSTIESLNQEAIYERFVDYSYNTFSEWTNDALSDGTLGDITNPVGPNEPAVFDITTIGSAGEKYIKLNSPVVTQDFEGDFLLDITAARIAWPQASLAAGLVKSSTILEIENLDGSTALLELGWKGVATGVPSIYYSGVIRDSGSVIVSSFDFEVEAPDSVGEEVLFRLRRTSDSIFAYYIIPGSIGDSLSAFGEYIRLGSNPSMPPGSGSVTISHQLSQDNSPTSGENFIVSLNDVVIRSEYSSVDSVETIPLGRDNSTSFIDRLTCNFPINLNSRTNIISAVLSMTVETGGVIPDTFNIIPLDILNAKNLGRIHEVPITQNNSLITSFIPGTVVQGDVIDVDITSTVVSFVVNSGHLPGFTQGFVIEPSDGSDSSFEISSDLSLLITYQDITTGVVFQVGVSIDPSTGIATFNTKNILYDASIEENRTVINIGVHLKKSGFNNSDVVATIGDLSRVGIGTCKDESNFLEDNDCYFVVGNTAVGTFVEGPFPCSANLP